MKNSFTGRLVRGSFTKPVPNVVIIEKRKQDIQPSERLQ